MDVNTCFLSQADGRLLGLYSHLVPVLAIMILGVFAYWRAQNRFKSEIFFMFVISFSLWLVGDMLNWTSSNYWLVAATWAPLDFINIVFFLLLLLFTYVDVFEEKPSNNLMYLVLIVAIPPLVITLFGQAVYEFYLPVCEMFGNGFLAQYKLAVEIGVLGSVLALATYRIYFKGRERREWIRELLTSGSMILFMGVFAGAEYISTQTAVYETMLYALFSTPIFILLLTIAITSYGTFRLGDHAVKALFYVFLVLAGTQFFSVQNITGFLLAGMSFGVVLTLGIMLFRLSEREIAQRHLIEKQEKELEVVNAQQENLLHFISHEVKGYLTESQAGFASIVEGDYGPPSPPLKSMAEYALAKVRKGVATVTDILQASNMKQGTVTYKKESFDFKDVVQKVVADQKHAAYERHLGLDVHIAEGDYMMQGDEAKLRDNVIRNLIDNAIRYTLAGTIRVELSHANEKIRFSVKDSGVGITPEDMPHLFTEGSHGKDSVKVNVHSTGYGLFIAKQVVDVHGGRIWAESEGGGKGSRFVVELPTSL